MNPYKEDILEDFKGTISDSFVEEDPIECPPIPLIYGELDSSVYTHECEGTNDDDEIGNRGFYSNTLCGIYYSTFYNLQLQKDSFGAAIYITTDQSIPTTLKEQVKIYKCNFTWCQADVGGAIYIKSTEINRIFDIN